MNNSKLNRRKFIQTTALGTLSVSTLGSLSFSMKNKNTIPTWRGFNILDFFNAKTPLEGDPNLSKEDDFKWMKDWGFDFVRIPIAYPRYISYDQSKNITAQETCNFDDRKVAKIVETVELALKYGHHVSINLHRAPGFCVNAGFHEPFNLWKDERAQEAFAKHWTMWAQTFAHIDSESISFDLVNEPCMREDMNDQHGERTTIPGAIYRKVAKEASDAIRSISPKRLIIADGNDVGSSIIPEITDLNIAQSCRGYFPHYISHYRAPWVFKNPDDAPLPIWPGKIDGQSFSRQNIEEIYAPWIALKNSGVGVHCGECGCWKETPHHVFLAWFEDVIDVLTSNNIGYALWNFRGEFGILDSGRKDVEYEEWNGHQLDRKLLNLLMKY